MNSFVNYVQRITLNVVYVNIFGGGYVMEKYYLGLDMGTSSVGWAVTDENYQLMRKKGKDLWGVRLFQEAKTAEERRTNRVSRRRRQREVARIGYLKEMFATEIDKIDPGFFQRLDDSRFFEEDKNVQQRFSLFAGDTYTDKEYYEDYPTIYHLRKELMESSKPHDVRLVYLAILNMFKHRGHFLNATLEDGKIGDLNELYKNLRNGAETFSFTELKALDNTKKLEEIISSKKISKSRKVEEVRDLLGIEKKDKSWNEVWKLVCGLSATVSVIFLNETFSEENKKYKFSFEDGNYDEKILEVADMLSEEAFDFLMLLKQIHDWGVLADIMCGESGTYEFLSLARVDSYEKHKEDLRLLKRVFKEYAPEQYNKMFREMEENNYSAYVGSVNVGSQKVRRGKKGKREDFYKNLQKYMKEFPETEEVKYILNEIEKGTFLPKQLTASNGVIPNQVHMAELKRILENAEGYLPFLTVKDENGLTVSEKIIKLFGFQIPYYIGPLVNTENNNAWVIRKENGRVFPWNFEQKIDVKQSAEMFIQNMVKHCTYLSDEQVLPKNSLLYERFMVLNELNNLRINGESISVELKQDIYNHLFQKGKKVTGKDLKNYLKRNGLCDPDEEVEITGIDGDFVNRLANYKKFVEVFQTEQLTYEQTQIAEKIIFWSTVYGDSRKFLKEKIEEEYGQVLTKEQIKRIIGYKFKDWGRLSKEFLQMEGADKKTGEIDTIISRMWNENYNLMQLLGDDLFTYREELLQKTKGIEKTLVEIEYEDLEGLYISAPVRRMTWQTILILRELTSVMGAYPDKVFVEMAREHQQDGKRTVSRKKKFVELYKNCKGEERQWSKEIEGTEESMFRSKKLYLYYTQKGRCMYTGETIDLSQLFNDNLYDIDHIYPRHFVKDDNIDNNLVLVKKQINAHKSDVFPLEHGIRQKQWPFWKELREGGFITEEKYKRLTRNDEFSEDEQAGFISRQLVETRQGTKAITDLLQQTCRKSEIIYVKAGNVSEFRHKYDLLKCRSVNDFHHAQDAYLNIVVGNVYDTKFTKSPKNFVKEYKKGLCKYHMDKIFDYDVKRGNNVAWDAKRSIGVVKNVMKKNTPLVTMMNFEAHGALADQTLYSAEDAKKAKGEGYIPFKSSDNRLKNTMRYGGFKKFAGAYFFVVEYEEKGKRVRSIETMPIYLKDTLNSKEKMMKYCEEQLGYIKPTIVCQKIKMYSLMKVNGFFVYLTGRTGKQLSVVNAVQMILPYKWSKYVKKMYEALEQENVDYINHSVISKANNVELFKILMDKHKSGIYGKKPNSVGEKLEEWEKDFEKLNIEDQCKILGELLKLSQRNNQGVDMSILNGGKKMGVSLISKKISGLSECKVINQSVTGLYENETDLIGL